jgi:hypothetical protein
VGHRGQPVEARTARGDRSVAAASPPPGRRDGEPTLCTRPSTFGKTIPWSTASRRCSRAWLWHDARTISGLPGSDGSRERHQIRRRDGEGSAEGDEDYHSSHGPTTSPDGCLSDTAEYSAAPSAARRIRRRVPLASPAPSKTRYIAEIRTNSHVVTGSPAPVRRKPTTGRVAGLLRPKRER